MVPVEGSQRDPQAMQKASTIAKTTGSKMVLLHVQEPRRYGKARSQRNRH